jgi:hypothetical protein
MHNADVNNSERLAQTLRIIRAGGKWGASTKEISSWTGSVAVATDVSEIRKNGYDIECVYDHTNENGRRVYRYHYRGKKEQ